LEDNMTNERQPAPVDDSVAAARRAVARRIDRVNGQIYVGGALPLEQFEQLAGAGITRVVDLREEPFPQDAAARLEELGIARRQVPVINDGAPTYEQMVEVADWLSTADQADATYIHCGGGNIRASTMVAGLLVHNGASVDEALTQVRSARPEMRLGDEHVAWLREVELRSRPA
jgi:protein tyrosine phosphatase (PTP) superfamily phosphohydrolase (DUF442 family)